MNDEQTMNEVRDRLLLLESALRSSEKRNRSYVIQNIVLEVIEVRYCKPIAHDRRQGS